MVLFSLIWLKSKEFLSLAYDIKLLYIFLYSTTILKVAYLSYSVLLLPQHTFNVDNPGSLQNCLGVGPVVKGLTFNAVAQVHYPHLVSHVGRVCCCFSSLPVEFFSRSSGFPPTKANTPNFNVIWKQWARIATSRNVD